MVGGIGNYLLCEIAMQHHTNLASAEPCVYFRYKNIWDRSIKFSKSLGVHCFGSVINFTVNQITEIIDNGYEVYVTSKRS